MFQDLLKQTGARAGFIRVPDTEADAEHGRECLEAVMEVRELSRTEREGQTDQP